MAKQSAHKTQQRNKQRNKRQNKQRIKQPKTKKRSRPPLATHLAHKSQARLERERKKLSGVTGWPVAKSMIAEDWVEQGNMWVLIARQRPDGLLAVGVFLVDTWCLGVRDAAVFHRLTCDQLDATIDFLDHRVPLQPCSASLAVKVIEEARAHAARIGIEPTERFSVAKRLLDGIDPHECSQAVLCGEGHGCPITFHGGHDDVESIVDDLARCLVEDACGGGGMDPVPYESV
jgi:hypothetical protein